MKDSKVLKDEAVKALVGHLNKLNPSEAALPIEWGEDWVVSYDSDPLLKGYIARTMVLDLNDDGYFMTMVGKWRMWAMDEDYTLDALTYIGDDDEQFVPVKVKQ